MNKKEFNAEHLDAMTDLTNAMFSLDYLYRQMDLNNPTPLNKMAYSGMRHGLDLLEKAIDELHKGELYNPADKMPNTNNCHLCQYFKDCNAFDGCKGFSFAG